MAISTTTTVSYSDPTSAYTAYQTQITAMIQAAVGAWQAFDSTPTGLTVSVDFLATGTSNIMVGSPIAAYARDTITVTKEERLTGSNIEGVFTVAESEGTRTIRTGTDPDSTSDDMLISINPNFLTQLYFDPAPADANPAVTLSIPSTQYDAYTLFRHAVAQGLGFWGQRDPTSGEVSGTTISQYDRYVSFIASTPYFQGPATVAVNGTPLLLNASDLYHYTVGNPPATGLMTAGATLGARTDIGVLDWAIMRDTQLQYDTNSVETTGTDKADTLTGSTGDDLLSGDGGGDTLLGGRGSDLLAGGDGADLLQGDSVGAADMDILVGGNGNDTLYGGGGNDILLGQSDHDLLIGELGRDTLDGGVGNDRLYGDYVAGRDFNPNVGITPDSDATFNDDVLIGGFGDDSLHGGAGADTLEGGLGADVFIYAAASDSTASVSDVITDFRGSLKEQFTDGSRTGILFYLNDGTAVDLITASETVDLSAIADFRSPKAHTQGDRIDVTAMDAKTETTAHDAFTFIGTADFTAAGQLRWQQSGTNILVQANTTGTSGAELQITLQGIGGYYQMSAADFILGASASSGPLPHALGLRTTAQGVSADGDLGQRPDGVVVNLSAGTVSSDYGSVSVAGARNVLGGPRGDRIIGNAAANHLDGGDGNDTIFGSGGEDLLIGGAGADQAYLLSGGRYQVSGVETVTGSTQGDTLLLADGGQRLMMAAIETLIGGSGADWVTLGDDGNKMIMAAVETLIGGGGGDWIELGARGGRMIMAGVETLIGGGGADWIDLGDRGNKVILTAIETLIGGAGGDWITLGDRGNKLVMAGVETLIGGAGGDWVELGDRGNQLIVAGVETLIGGAGADLVRTGDRGGTLVTTAIETLIGGGGADFARLGDRGNKLIMAGVETLIGGGGADWITLGDRGGSVTMTQIETLVGGAGADSVKLGDTGNQMVVAAVETVVGGAGRDVLRLGDRGGHITVSDVEVIIGGTGNDDITATGPVVLAGGGNADLLRLATSGTDDFVVYASPADGADTIVGFEAERDKVLFTQALRGALDHDGDGQLKSVVRDIGAVDLMGDELVRLTTTIARVTPDDPDLIIGAIGAVARTGARSSMIAVAAAQTGDSGVYLISDDGDGVIARGEVAMLGRFIAAGLQTSNFAFG